MDHKDHVALLRGGVPGPAPAPAPVWADLGAGWGAFTLALADLLGPGATIYAVDRDRKTLREAESEVRARFPATDLHVQVADFTHTLDLPPLDGIVMANALHFVRDKAPVLARLAGLLKPGGRLILVEYNADHGNLWVPHPVSYPTWAALAARAGFRDTRRLAAVPSRFLHEIYSALSFAPEQ
jgi:SAM-dependent methyltransferase